MPLIPYSTFVDRVRQQVFPDGETHLEPINLQFPHLTYIQNGLIQAQTYVECLRGNNVNTYAMADVKVNCGVAIIAAPEHVRVGAIYAYKPAKGCTRQHYTQTSVNRIMCFVDAYAGCRCKTEADICNAVRTGDEVCDNLSLCDDAPEDGQEDDQLWLCDDKIFAVGRGSQIYLAPRFPCGYRLAIHWEGIKYRYADEDLISDDPDLLDLVSTYVQGERARTFDRDIPLWRELLGNGPSRRGMGGSAWHNKMAAMAHRCREERRIRTRTCSEMWDDSALSSENIGSQLNPVPDRDEAGIDFERCDGCPEGQVLIDGECVDCLTPAATLVASDTTLVPGEVVTLTWNTSNVIDLESSTVKLSWEGGSVDITPNESGSLSFTPTENTTYTLTVNTVCGDVTATVEVTVSETPGCACPDAVPDCLRIVGFDDTTFARRAVLTEQEQAALVEVDAPTTDLSGITYSQRTGTLFGIRDQATNPSQIVEYDLSGTVLRTITTTNFIDTESIVWMHGKVFAISEENPVNRITIVTIEDDTTALDWDDFSARSFSTGLAAGNNGVEGCCYDPARDLIYFTTEKIFGGEWWLWEMNPNTGLVAQVCDLLANVSAVITDIGDLYYDPETEHVYLLADSGTIVEITMTGEVVRTLDISADGFTQPEGLTFNRNLSQMWVAGEPNQLGRYAAAIEDCVAGNTSTADTWDGTLERVGEGCVWGFQLGTKSYRGYNTSAFVLLDHCEEDGTPVFRLQVLVNTGTGAQVIWNGTARNLPIGTYERDTELSCGPVTVELQGCACENASPELTFTPPAGSKVSFPSVAFITASDETALIFYTLDGSEPTNNSTPYTGPIQLTETDILKARAYTAECVGDWVAANYEAVAGFALDFICDNQDRAGVFDEFAPNGVSPDYHWALQFGLAEERTVKRLELYETNSQGVWVTGQAWATQNPIYPIELAGLHPFPTLPVGAFPVYPLVIDNNGSQLQTNYGEPVIVLPPGDYVWQMFGQPFVPLTGYFKLLFVLDDGEGGEEVIYKLINHDCYYCDDYETYGACEEDDGGPPVNEQSNNIINIAIQHSGNTLKNGAAVVGLPGDYWNTLNFPLGDDPDVSAPTLKWANGVDTGTGLAEYSDMPAFGSTGGPRSIFDGEFTTTHLDPMMKKGGTVISNNYARQLRLVNLGRGTYDVYIYGHGELNAAVVRASILSALFSRPEQETENSATWAGNWVEGANYIKFSNFQFSLLEEATLSIAFGESRESFVQGIQIVKKA